MNEAFFQHGVFSWCELMTTDVDAAKRFYGELLGWSLADVPVSDASYTMITVGGREIGGIMAIPRHVAGASPSWGAYVTVDDVDATAQKAQALGARTIVPPTDIPDVGRFFMFQDPQGAVLSVITYLEKSEG
jgi:predicted enzyme related to lactoylglutathione lyase